MVASFSCLSQAGDQEGRSGPSTGSFPEDRKTLSASQSPFLIKLHRASPTTPGTPHSCSSGLTSASPTQLPAAQGRTRVWLPGCILHAQTLKMSIE